MENPNLRSKNMDSIDKTKFFGKKRFYKNLKNQKHEKHIKIQRMSRIPGSEPILLDLEKLFLLSDSMDSSDKTKFFGKNKF